MLCFLFPGFAKLLGLSYFDINSINFFDKLTHQIIDKRLADKNYEGKCQISVNFKSINNKNLIFTYVFIRM